VPTVGLNSFAITIGLKVKHVPKYSFFLTVIFFNPDKSIKQDLTTVSLRATETRFFGQRTQII
jgi:hypothetical protein